MTNLDRRRQSLHKSERAVKPMIYYTNKLNGGDKTNSGKTRVYYHAYTFSRIRFSDNIGYYDNSQC